MKIFAIFDRKAELYNTPFMLAHKAIAERHFSRQVIDDGSSVLHTNPADFVLVELGSFDEKTGKIETFESPQQIIDAEEVLDAYYALEGSKEGKN